MDRLEEQRVVHDQQVGAPLRGLLRHRRRRVDREHHLADVLPGVAGDQPDRVPRVRGGGRVPTVQQVDEVAERGHVAKARPCEEWRMRR
jgi:hypothetical protein